MLIFWELQHIKLEWERKNVHFKAREREKREQWKTDWVTSSVVFWGVSLFNQANEVFELCRLKTWSYWIFVHVSLRKSQWSDWTCCEFAWRTLLSLKRQCLKKILKWEMGTIKNNNKIASPSSQLYRTVAH